jgi:hypothetical protein
VNGEDDPQARHRAFANSRRSMTQNLLLREAHSLSAISKLEPAFPYAATLLVYTVIERCLKIYLLTNIDTLPEKIYNYQIPIQISNGRPKMTLADCRGSRKLLQSYLTNCPLGVLEKIYKIRPSRYSPARNGVFHSNLYIDDQLDVEEYEIRNRMNHGLIAQKRG